MPDGEVLETLIKEGRELNQRVHKMSDTAHVLGERLIDLGGALSRGKELPRDFPFDPADITQAEMILTELPRLREQLANIESRIRKRTSLD